MKENKNTDNKRNATSVTKSDSQGSGKLGNFLSMIKSNDNLVIIIEIAVIIVLAAVLVFVITSRNANGGNDGGMPTIEISDDGYWVINGEKTSIKAVGQDGNDGQDGSTPTIEISDDGYWVINGEKTNVKAGEKDPAGDGGGSVPEKQKQSYKSYSFNYFDTVSTIIGYEELESEFAAISKEALELLGEYHKLFDIYNEYEGINNLYTINKLVDGKHQVVEVDRKIIDMLLYAKEMYELTDGKMNIAMGSVLSIWHDYRDAGSKQPVDAELPPMDLLIEAAKHTDINKIVIDEKNSTVWLSDPDMKLDVGAIAKGYAVEMVARSLEAKGKTSYTVNVGGNIRTVGNKANGEKWKAGIEDPMGGDYIEYIGLSSDAIVTSGSYQRYYIVDGERYHHIIDGETLMPADRGYLSVSVICKDSGMGDGLSTALFCMDLDAAMAFVNSLDGVEAMFVTEDEVKHYSNGFNKYIYK